ncbi:hypothetical protein HMN09_00469300 [Mycena chlorophos]|uniref:DUF6534 domain-containing protein n=1 Tax=Mycena chlorophos TaxID=658473 RepID=A0A8H6TIK0_MYCCL|nr:hypothetical protein HMN09_00469300 [Mycena chlorophos]
MAPPNLNPDIPTTLGSLLVGGSVALLLSGIVIVQLIVFYKLYPNDTRLRMGMVALVGLLDIFHSIFIVGTLFSYFINHFGNRARVDHIEWSLAMTVVITAIQTAIAHWYYAHKIWNSSKNKWMTGSVVFLAFSRLLAASVSTSEMIIHPSFANFTNRFPGWVFTTGLSLSAITDVVITSLLCFYLQSMRRRTNSTLMARVVRTMTLYTLENGLITCIAATATLICWLTMPGNLIFMGLHFVIGKLYANSLLISLNTRKELREMRWVGPKDSNPNIGTSMWPMVGGGAGSASAGSVGLSSPVGRYSGYGTGVAFTYPYGVVSSPDYGVGGSVDMSAPSSAYRPAFKVPVSPARTQTHDHGGIRVTRTVRRASDDLSVSDVSRDEYTYAAHAGVVGRRNQFGAAVHTRRSRDRDRERELEPYSGALP